MDPQLCVCRRADEGRKQGRRHFQLSVQRSCRLALLRRSVWYAKSQARDQSALRLRIREIAMNRPRFGYLRMHVMLRREGWAINKKRVWRLYRIDGLQLRIGATCPPQISHPAWRRGNYGLTVDRCGTLSAWSAS